MHPKYSDMQRLFISRADQKRLIAKLPPLQRLWRISAKWLIFWGVHSSIIFLRPILTIDIRRVCFYFAMFYLFSSQNRRFILCFSRMTGREKLSPSTSQFFRFSIWELNFYRKNFLRLAFLLWASFFASLFRKIGKATTKRYFLSNLLILFWGGFLYFGLL